MKTLSKDIIIIYLYCLFVKGKPPLFEKSRGYKKEKLFKIVNDHSKHFQGYAVPDGTARFFLFTKEIGGLSESVILL
jgi:hypothetical protein